MRKEIKIGIAFVIGLFLLFFGLKFLKGVNIFKPSNSYVATFGDVSGLNISSPVLMNGFKVGLVSQMAVDPSNPAKIVVTVDMDKGVQIPKGSKFKLDVSMLGSASLLLEMNPYSKDIASLNDTLMGYAPLGMLDKVQKEMMPQVMVLLPKIDSILTGIQVLVNHPALQSSLANIDATTKNLQQATQSLNQMMLAMNKQVPVITHNLAVTSGNVSEMTTRFNKLEFEKTFAKIDSTMSNVQYISGKFASKDNSLGLLLNDRQMYDSLHKAIGNTSGLLEDLKKNPRKYINLKVF